MPFFTSFRSRRARPSELPIGCEAGEALQVDDLGVPLATDSPSVSARESRAARG